MPIEQANNAVAPEGDAGAAVNPAFVYAEQENDYPGAPVNNDEQEHENNEQEGEEDDGDGPEEGNANQQDLGAEGQDEDNENQPTAPVQQPRRVPLGEIDVNTVSNGESAFEVLCLLESMFLAISTVF